MSAQNLPPLNALRVFEAVARLGGVRLAAQELCVTPPAVSHQISNLEDFLGSPLFVRRGRSLVLTETAKDYLVEVRPSLEAIARATTVASQRKVRETVTLAAPPTLVSMWLMPRLPGFMQQHPEYDLRIIDRMTFDPEERGIDVALEYRFEPDPDLVSQRILKDDVAVLATRELADRHNLASLESLKGLTLIETERRLTSWKTLLSHYSWATKQRYLFVSYSLHAFEAASRGIGVALGNRANAERMVAEGRLCVPFTLDPSEKPTVPSYFLTALPHKQRLKRVQLLWEWLEAEAARDGIEIDAPT
ncbi:LysR family transcriptional regulator [Mameliella alba]|nr:LysR family transcriptional regulator [Mameliella alba]MBY6170946.1 LysR family transcriptional regulator [Mameliella alba]MBY6175959.1 LysR family transcriptional regulator [Mameliella alba]